MKDKQHFAVVGNTKVLMKLIGFEAQIKSKSKCFCGTKVKISIPVAPIQL